MFATTKSEALAIQAEQVAHYAAIYGEEVRELVAAATHPEAIDDAPHPVREVHRAIPCGGRIEALLMRAGLGSGR